MAKYRRPPQEIAEKPTFFAKHYWHEFVDWADKNKDNLLTGVLVAAVVVLGAVVYQRYAASKAGEAWSQLGLARSTAQLETAAARYGSTAAGPFLKLKLADLYVNEGKPEKAIGLYREVAGAGMSSQTPTQTALAAEYSLGFAQEAMGQFDAAKAVFEALAAKGGFWGAEAQKALANQGERAAAYEDLKAALAAAAKKAEEEKAKADSALSSDSTLSNEALQSEATGSEPAAAAEEKPAEQASGASEGATTTGTVEPQGEGNTQ